MKLDRDYMLNVIEQGGSVIINGKHFSKVNITEFPSIADLAKGDAEAEKVAENLIEEQLQALLAERAKLKASKETEAVKVVKEVKEDDTVKETAKKK